MHDALWWNAILLQTSDPLTFLLLAASVPGLSLDFTQRIVNVHWGDGLAVEFYAAAE